MDREDVAFGLLLALSVSEHRGTPEAVAKEAFVRADAFLALEDAPIFPVEVDVDEDDMDPPEVVDVAGDGLPHVPLDNPQPVGDTQPSPPLAPAEGTAQNEAPGENPDPKG